MIKFYPERKTPDLYSEAYIEEISLMIGIKSKDQKHDLKEYLEHAAENFIRNWTMRKNGLTQTQTLRRLEKTLPILEKCKHIYDDIDRGVGMIVTDFNADNTVFFRPNEQSNQMAEIIEKTKAIIDAPMISTSKTKTRIVLTWLWDISDFWDEYINITLSEGREANSKAIDIILKMLFPIKNCIPDPASITSSLIAEALKENRLYNKQGYLLTNNKSGALGTKDNPKLLKTLDFRDD